MKYFIETYGCQMSVHDAERMAGLLESSGYDRTESEADADLVVINTCSVRERAEEKLYTRLGEIKEMGRELGRDPIVAVTGCVAQQEGDKLIARSAGVVDVLNRHAQGVFDLVILVLGGIIDGLLAVLEWQVLLTCKR